MDMARRREQLSKVVRDPIAYLAYVGLRSALKKCGLVSPTFGDSFYVVVIPPGYPAPIYKTAMHALLDVEREEWGEQYGAIRLAAPMGKRTTLQQPISVFDLRGLRVLIAGHIDEVPHDVRFAAADIIKVLPPSANHISAARRMSGKTPISARDASALTGKPLNVIIAALYKDPLGTDDVVALLEMRRVQGPSLSDLPGYTELKVWAGGVRSDVEKWRTEDLEWKAISRGALIAGVPGTGKTLFASALANSLQFELIKTTVGAWQAAGHLDDMLKAMRKNFADANSGRGAVLFIDEFDGIGTRPSTFSNHPSHQYWQIVINEFLSQMNSLGEGVIVLGATNYPGWIDPAILRAGRMERRFTLTLPDTSTRAEILRYHLKNALPVESLLRIAEELEGKTAAELEELARDAQKVARDDDRVIDLRDLESFLPEKRQYTAEQRLQLAVHEAGHALLALSLGYATSATIEIRHSFDPAADAHIGGLTSYDLTEDHFPTEAGLLNRIAVCLAGMAAEAVVFNNRSIGSGGTRGSDVERATVLARRMVASYGLGKTPVFVAVVEEIRNEVLPQALEEEVMDLLRTQYERVVAKLSNEKDRIVEVAIEAVTNRVVRIERSSSTDHV